MALKTVKNQQLEKVKQELDPTLANNPSFDDVFLKELKYICFKTHSIDVDIDISHDKKQVSLTSLTPVMTCSVDKLNGTNKSYINSKIYVNNKDMIVEYNQGVVFDRRRLEKQGFKSYALFESRLETYYSLSCYDEFGFEYSDSSYIDSYPVSKRVVDIDVKEEMESSFHKPEFNLNMLPKSPIHVINAEARNTYRKKGSYSVIHTNMATITPEGYKDVKCGLYTTHYLTPELLRGEKRIARAVEHEGRYIFIIDRNYADSIEEGYKRAKRELKIALEKVKSDYEKETYDYMIENI